MNESSKQKLDAFLSQRRAQSEEVKRIDDARQSRAAAARDRFIELKTLVIQPTMASITQYVAEGVDLQITDQSDHNTRQGTSIDAQISIHTGNGGGGAFYPTSLSFVYRGGDKVVIHRLVGASGGPMREILIADITSDLVETELVEWLDLIANSAQRGQDRGGSTSTLEPTTVPSRPGRSPTDKPVRSGPLL